MKELDERHIHDGHRKRMLEKLVKHDGDIFESYELLEMLLFFRLPYKNTNPIAKKLLHKFGSLKGVFEAEQSALTEISGVGERCAEFIKAVGELFTLESDDGDIGVGEEVLDEQRIASMLHSQFSENQDATFVILALDNAGRVISSELFYGVDFNSGALNATYYTEFALKSSASVIVTASHRRYGSALPMPYDRESAVMVSKALDSIDVFYGEHFVFSGGNYSRVLPTLVASRFKNPLMLNAVWSDETPLASENENNNCHNQHIISLFDKITSAFCDEHFEKVSMLFERFSSFSSVLMTDYRALASVVGERLAAFVRIVANIAKRRVTDLISPADISDERELGEYLSALCIPLSKEAVFLVSYDGDGRVISVDKAGEGTLNSSSVTPRALIEIAMRNSAKRVAVAHNHPHGKAELSSSDIAFTKTLYEAFLALGIELSVHICISGSSVCAASAPMMMCEV